MESTPPGSKLALVNGKIYQHSDDASQSPQFAECMVVDGGSIEFIGSRDDAMSLLARQAVGYQTKDLHGRVALPGFIDGHMHLLMLGQALKKVDLDGCANIEEIRSRIREFAASHPESPRVFCRGWMQSMTPDGVTTALLDDLDPRPIFVDSKDLHSTWCNAAALHELDVADMRDPVGGTIHRDSSGAPSGLLEESVVYQVVWPHIARVSSEEEKVEAIRAAIAAYHTAGYTGMVEMAMDETIWTALLALRGTKKGLNGMHVSAYWLVKPCESVDEVLAQIDHAANLAMQFNQATSPDCRIVGIKLICDGIVDGCTASLKEPYSVANTASPDPIWSEDRLHAIVARAHAHNLQVALHAIGDRTVTMALDVLERNTDGSRRPRIEHLELTTEQDAQRLGRLGITASIQPVHADPAILEAWPRLIGAHRCKRAFAYREFAAGGAPLALGSDAPTAPHLPLANCYVATTRRSARKPLLETRTNPEQALSVCQAIAAATRGAAYSCFAELRTGSLRPGLRADFVICDLDLEPTGFLAGVVKETWSEGRRVFAADESRA